MEFQTSSQVLLMLVVWELNFETHSIISLSSSRNPLLRLMIQTMLDSFGIFNLLVTFLWLLLLLNQNRCWVLSIVYSLSFEIIFPPIYLIFLLICFLLRNCPFIAGIVCNYSSYSFALLLQCTYLIDLRFPFCNHNGIALAIYLLFRIRWYFQDSTSFSKLILKLLICFYELRYSLLSMEITSFCKM